MGNPIKLFSFLLVFTMICCRKENTFNVILETSSIIFLEQKKGKLIENDLKSWPIKDIIEDTIPGTSLLKANRELLQGKQGQIITVALIDMPIDSDHPDLESHIWKNSDEVPENGIDDDHNGYIDDLNGWNFLGNSEGQNIAFMNYEYTRILRKYNGSFENKTLSDIKPSMVKAFKDYMRAKEAFQNRMNYAKEKLESAKSLDSLYFGAKKLLSKYLPDDNFSKFKLDSLKKVYEQNKGIVDLIQTFEGFKNEGIDDEHIKKNNLTSNERLDKLLNLEYDQRIVVRDSQGQKDIGYGNNIINHNLDLLHHGTLMAGILTSNFNENSLTNLTNNIKIMPLCVSGLGDERDKDIAIAIRYAVDNDAKVINISSGKYFSLNKDWISEAILYAEAKDVLIVASSGNRGLNIDLKDVYKYPSDIDSTGVEIANNFIRVGGSNYTLDSTIVHPATNYGKSEVDIFAPGEEIFTTSTNDKKYGYTSGTSGAAAIVSKIAALVVSYYPDLSVGQLKDILLMSGVEYTIAVPKEDEEGNKNMVPFNELSKSGKIINAYNALVMAEKVSKLYNSNQK